MSNENLIVQCPTCGAKVEWKKENTFRPFCSERCKLIDLGAWFDNSRVIRGGSDEELQQLDKSLPPIVQDYVDLHNQEE